MTTRISSANRALLSAGIAWLVMCASLLAACSRGPAPAPVEAMLQTEILLKQYGGRVDLPFVNEYLSYLNQRLGQGLESGTPDGLDIILLRSTRPVAFAPGRRSVLVSAGLIRLLNSEAELAFVLAHEIAHHELGHTLQYSASDAATAELRPELELAADRFAVATMAAAGYDPRAAVSALRNAYSHQQAGATASHPLLQERLTSIGDMIQSSGWLPPGTLDRRSFKQIKQLLR